MLESGARASGTDTGAGGVRNRAGHVHQGQGRGLASVTQGDGEGTIRRKNGQLVTVMVIGAALLITMTISMLIVVLVLRLVVMETVALVDEVLVLMMMAHVLVLCY